MKQTFSIILLLSLFAFSLKAEDRVKTVLTAPTEVSMSVFGGFADSTKVFEPVSKEISGKITKYTFMLEPGDYHFISSGYRYNTLDKNFIVTDKVRTLDADPGLKSEKGYQNKVITHSYTDEVNNTALSTKELSKKYPLVLTTPGFKGNKPALEYTTQREMEDYLDALDSGCGYMYTYVAGYSTKGMKLPLAVFSLTRLEGKNLEEAGAAVLANGKPTVFLHAEIHGDEASGGEGALSMCAELCGQYGTRILKSVNVIVMPRVNPDGTRDWTRGTSVYPDMNRDNLLVRNPEIKATHRVYNAFLPEVVIDMHEYGVERNYTLKEGFLDDAGITVSGNQNNTKELNELQKEMMRLVEKKGLENNLRYWEYVQAGYSDQSSLHASHYYALRSSTNFLVETPNGKCEKKSSFARRTFAQYFVARTLIDYAAENSQLLQSTCRKDREYVSAAKDPFVLRHGQNTESYSYQRSIFSLEDGRMLRDTTYSLAYYEVPLITRERPKAYVISKDVKKIARILQIADYNGITYEEVPAGTKMTLRQYAQNPKWEAAETGKKFVADKREKCALLEAQETEFPNGAYIFKTAQPSSIVLSFLMEPDVIKTDRYPITLVQEELLSLDELYRSE